MLATSGSSEPVRFAILSNTRCGSTWLATSLASSAPEIAVDYECKLEDYASSSVHRPIGSTDPAGDLDNVFHNVLQKSDQRPAAVGTKITLDASIEPHHRSGVTQRLEKLLAISEGMPHLKVIHLTRRFCGQFASRGGHTLSTQGLTVNSGVMQSALVVSAREAAYSASNSLDEGTTHHCSARRVLHRFANDICMAEAFNTSTNYLNVNYETLEQDWEEVLRFLGLEVHRSLQESSVTLKNQGSASDFSCQLGRSLTDTRDRLFTLGRTRDLSSAIRDSVCLSSGLVLDHLDKEFRHIARDPSEVEGRMLLKNMWSRVGSRLQFSARSS